MEDHDEGLDDVIQYERQAWAALSTSGEAAASFYRDVLADEVVMLLPGGLVIDDRDEVIDSMSGEPWDEFDLADERVIDLTGDSVVVTYRASARRGDMRYQALFNSTYVRDAGHWRLVLHQQTPL